MSEIRLHVENETSLLKSVIIGRASIGNEPSLLETYDASSYISVLNKEYPQKSDIKKELLGFENILKKYNVNIIKPKCLNDCNQIFARDVSFVINDTLINPNIISNRMPEKEAYKKVFSKIPYNKIYNLPPNTFVEGGDVVLYNDIIFIGVSDASTFDSYKTARTNMRGYEFLKEIFPTHNFIVLELKKDDMNPNNGVLHLDCAFMPVSKNKAIVCKEAFIDKKYYNAIVDIFGEKNLFNISNEERVRLNSNVFSISHNVVVSEKRFQRLNLHLEQNWGLRVEKVSYSEVAKMGGLFRCSTLPLERTADNE